MTGPPPLRPKSLETLKGALVRDEKKSRASKAPFW